MNLDFVLLGKRINIPFFFGKSSLRQKNLENLGGLGFQGFENRVDAEKYFFHQRFRKKGQADAMSRKISSAARTGSGALTIGRPTTM